MGTVVSTFLISMFVDLDVFSQLYYLTLAKKTKKQKQKQKQKNNGGLPL